MYTAVWLGPAQNHLATIWMAAPDRDAVTRAANTIDERLRRDPYADSESREGDSRITLLPPLGVSYDVSDDDRLVTVWAVWRI
jgi:hypothetical protein